MECLKAETGAEFDLLEVHMTPRQPEFNPASGADAEQAVRLCPEEGALLGKLRDLV